MSDKFGIKTHENQKTTKVEHERIKPDSETSLHSVCACSCRTFTSLHFYVKNNLQQDSINTQTHSKLFFFFFFCIVPEQMCNSQLNIGS